MTGPAQRQDEAEALQREALDWISKMSLDGASETDLAELREWRGRSSAHADAFSVAARTWRSLNPVLEAARRQEELTTMTAARRPAVFGRRAVLGGMVGLSAAAAAGFMVVRPPLGLWPSLSELSADYRTGVGQQRKVSVGTIASVELNTDTSITLRPDAGGGTGIELISGEVAISKMESGGIQFVVVAGEGRAATRQATFNIRRDGTLVCVTCIDGDVQVEQGGHALSIGAGQQISYGAAEMSVPVAVDPGLIAAWRDGMLVFHDQPIARVIDEVNRYRRGHIVLLNAALGRQRVTARFELDQLDDVIAQIDQVFGARVTALPGGIVLLS
jgi:transmembrane sensor